MGSNNNRIFIYFNNDQLKQLVTKFDTDIKEELTKQMKEYLLAAPTENQVTDIDTELKEWKLRKLKAETQIKEHELLYIQTFDNKPSPQAHQAIIQKYRASTPQQNQIDPETAMRFLESCKKNDLNQWVIICNLCRADFINIDINKTKSEFYTHLQHQHEKELLT